MKYIAQIKNDEGKKENIELHSHSPNEIVRRLDRQGKKIYRLWQVKEDWE